MRRNAALTKLSLTDVLSGSQEDQSLSLCDWWLVSAAPQHHLQQHGNSPLLLFLFACRERERLYE